MCCRLPSEELLQGLTKWQLDSHCIAGRYSSFGLRLLVTEGCTRVVRMLCAAGPD
jgi:hypothetical protein